MAQVSLKQLVGEVSDTENQISNKYWNQVVKLYNTQLQQTSLSDDKLLSISDRQWKDAWLYSTARKIENTRAGIVDRGFSDDMTTSEVLGMLAEVVVAEHYGVEWDKTTHPRKGGSDCTISSKEVDVKMCKIHNNENDMVVVEQNKQLTDADAYFFTKFVQVGVTKMIAMYGWLQNIEVIDRENQNETYPGYWLPKTKLHKFSREIK